MVKPLLLEGGRGAGAGGDDFFTLFETGVTMANERIETTPVPRPPRSLGAPYPIEAETLHARFLGDFSPSICFDQIFFLGCGKLVKTNDFKSFGGLGAVPFDTSRNSTQVYNFQSCGDGLGQEINEDFRVKIP